MESIYYVMTFLCHRQCPHCYEDRFRPYYGDDLERVVAESRSSFQRIIQNFPDRMTYLDIQDGMREKSGRVILAGGEILLDPVRESVLYPALEQLYEQYRDNGGVHLVVQTTGDVLNEEILRDLLGRHVHVVSVSGLDAFHAGQLDFEWQRDRFLDRTGVRPLVASDDANSRPIVGVGGVPRRIRRPKCGPHGEEDDAAED